MATTVVNEYFKPLIRIDPLPQLPVSEDATGFVNKSFAYCPFCGGALSRDAIGEMNDPPTNHVEPTTSYCCRSFEDALAEPTPLFLVDESEVTIAVGLREADEGDEMLLVEHTIKFCPFCGSRLLGQRLR